MPSPFETPGAEIDAHRVQIETPDVRQLFIQRIVAFAWYAFAYVALWLVLPIVGQGSTLTPYFEDAIAMIGFTIEAAGFVALALFANARSKMGGGRIIRASVFLGVANLGFSFLQVVDLVGRFSMMPLGLQVWLAFATIGVSFAFDILFWFGIAEIAGRSIAGWMSPLYVTLRAFDTLLVLATLLLPQALTGPIMFDDGATSVAFRVFAYLILPCAHGVLPIVLLRALHLGSARSSRTRA